MVVSSKWVGVVDPHWRCGPPKDKHKTSTPAGHLLQLTTVQQHRSHMECFDGIFGLSSTSSDYGATLFRFPLRRPNSESEICDETCTPKVVKEKMFDPFKTEARDVLLFLKNVTKVSLFQLDTSGKATSPEMLYQVSICKHNDHMESIKGIAKKYSQPLDRTHQPAENATEVSVISCVEEDPMGRSENQWLVVNVIGSSNVEIQRYATTLKVLPWVGIAGMLPSQADFAKFCISFQSSTQDGWADCLKAITRQIDKFQAKVPWSQGDQEINNGKVFCFMPLPENTALPVHINGYFAVTDDRSRIKWPQYDSNSVHAYWNKLLLSELIVPAYTVLMGCRAALVGYQVTSNSPCSDVSTEPYAAWPVYEEVRNKVPWRDLVQPVLQLALAMDVPLLWNPADGGKWLGFREARFLPSPTKDLVKCPESVTELLLQANLPIVQLPRSIEETVSTCPKLQEVCSLRKVTPSFVRDELRKSQSVLTAAVSELPTPTLSELLAYVISDLDGSSYHVLSGISLLPLLSGSVCQFQCSGNTTRYVLPPNLSNCVGLLPGIEDIIVDLSSLSDSTRTKVTDIATSEKLQLRIVTPELICQVLLKKSMSSWCTKQVTSVIPSAWKWEPGKFNHPPLEWIDRLWQWLCRVSDSVPLSTLSNCQLPVIPLENTNTQKGIHTILELPAKEHSTLCTFHPGSPPKSLKPVLQKLGLVVVEGSRFMFNHPQIHEVIPNVTVPLVVERILVAEPEQCIHKLSNGEKDTLRMLLASYYGSGQNPVPAKYKPHLKSLPIFRAVPESSSRFIALEGSIHPQATPTLPDYPNNWLAQCPSCAHFMEQLDAPTLPPELFCSRHLIPFALKRQYSAAIIWVLRQEIPIVPGSSFYMFLLRHLKIPSRINPTVWKKPAELYDPRDEQFLALFNPSDDVFPATEYSEEPRLLDKLRMLGLNFWEKIKSNNVFIKERATSVGSCANDVAIKRGKCILQSLIERRFDDAFLKALADVVFILADDCPPESCVYPIGLKWYGSVCPNRLYSIRETGLLSPENAILVGSVMPLLCRHYNVPLDHPQLLNAFYQPTATDILDQLRSLIQLPLSARDVEVMNSAVLCIYKYLEDHVEELPSLDIPIWWHSQGRFIPTDRIVLKQPKGLPTLEPFSFFIAHNSELKSFRQLLKKFVVRTKLERADAISILRHIKETADRRESNQLSDNELDIVCNLLEWIYKQRFETHGEILVPTEKNQLVSPHNCTFDDREWIQNTQLTVANYTFVHPKVHKELAQYFHVQPLSQQVAPSRKLKLKYIQAGPHEKITHRIQHIVREYATDIDIFKELIQNADDAGATEISFLVDWRTHSSESLLSDSLKHWQGPALLAYNNAVFSDQDLDNICQLAGETKLKDPTKTGRFGVGFCATYHLTDLPSFISREHFTMFDPHTTYLRDRISPREPGIRVNLFENQQDLKIYADQFSPYDGLFGCNVFSLPPGGFKGTLFRFPFRSAETARRSEISEEVYTQDKVQELTSALRKSASEILLFLKHIKKLSFLVYENSSSEVKKEFSVERKTSSMERLELIKAYSPSSVVGNPAPVFTTAEMCLYENNSLVSTTQWLLCSVLGTRRSHQLCSTDDGVKRGLVPLTEVALRVKRMADCQTPDPVEGHIFCFLPLPIPSGLPVHISGFFDIGKDRRSLTATDDKTFGSEWNIILAEDSLPQALLHMLAFLAETFQTQKCPENHWSKLLNVYYSLYDFSQAKGIVRQSLVKAFKKELQTTQLKILWSQVGGGKWVPPCDAFIFRGAQKIYIAAIKVMILKGYNVVELPEHLQAMLSPVMDEQKHVVNYQRFCNEILLPNIGDIPSQLRDEHLLFLLEKCASGRYSREYGWMKTLLHGRKCIPCESTTTLLHPQELVDCRKSHLANLYKVSDGRFPSKIIQENPPAMDGLVALGMANLKLRLEDLQDRAKTVSLLATSNVDAANQRSVHVLDYISYLHASFLHEEEEIETLRVIPFLPVVKPEVELPWWTGAPFVSPSQAVMYTQKSLVFSRKPVVKLPSELADCLGVARADAHVVLAHFVCLISHFKNTEVPSAVAEYLNAEKVMEQIYRYFNTHTPGMYSTLEEAMVQKLGKFKFIWQDNHFLSASQVVTNWQHDCYPYICKISSTNSQFTQFFLRMGVKETASYEMLLQALERICADHAPSQPISDPLLTFVEHVAGQVEMSFNSSSSKPIYLPDEHKVMRCTSTLACGKIREAWMNMLDICRSHFEEGRGYFVHSNIPTKRAVLLGARSVLDAVLKEIEDEEFLTGSDFGQEEDLCDRLNCILRKYPADRSIFQEFIQNADDAQASEIVFILDHRTSHADQKLFTCEAGWTSLQHMPALCIVNNRKFTEKDIVGITQLGKGGKEQSPELIGRFGIGFNVSYHLTDCPSFVSFGESGVPQNFCVLDPTRSFIHSADKGRPGRRWKLSKDHVEQFSDQFQPYLLNELPQLANLAPSCLQQLEDTGYVVFRLPLTRHPSGVPRSSRKLGGSTIFGPAEILKLFGELKQISSDMLLFLNNLKCISVFEIAQNNEYTHHFTTLLSNPPPISFSKLAVKTALGNSPNPLTEFHQVTVKHMETQSGENGSCCTRTKSTWLVQRRVDCSALDKTLLQKAAAHSLQPLGGVAARVDAHKQHPCYVFCFLPMNMPSSLPVHVNGHFLLDDSRKHFEEIRHEGLGEWNKSLVEGVIAPAYADMLIRAREFVPQNGLGWYYSLFPQVGKGGDLASLGLVKAVYSKLFTLNGSVLVREVPLNGPTLTPQFQWLQIRGEKKGYFCVQYVDDRKKKLIEVTPGLREVLVTLQMLITSAPKDIYESFGAAVEEFKQESRITPQVVLSHLQRLDFTRPSNSVVLKQNVEHILGFIIDGFPDPKIKQILQSIPLVVDAGGSLRKIDTTFESRFAALLPHCCGSFVDSNLEKSSVGKHLQRIQVIVPLSVDFLARNLTNPCRSRSPIPLTEPLKVILRLLWEYIVHSHPLGLHRVLKEHFSCIPIIPSDRHTLFPVCLAKALMHKNDDNANVQRLMMKLGCPFVDFTVVGQDHSPLIANLSTSCTSTNDVVKCLQLNDLKYDVCLTKEEVLSFIAVVSVATAGITEKLQKMQLFEQIDGSFVSMKKCSKVFIMPRGVPADGIVEILKHGRHVVLKAPDSHLAVFYENVIPNYSSVAVTTATFYKSLVLPQISHMKDETVRKHIVFLADSFELPHLQNELQETPLICHEGKLQRVSFFFDPKVEFFTTFYSSRLLPKPWRCPNLLPVLRFCLGLQTEVPRESWIREAQSLANSAGNGMQRPASSILKRSHVLLDSLINFIPKVGLQQDTKLMEFLTVVSEIRFIHNPESLDVREIIVQLFPSAFKHKYPSQSLVCFKAAVRSSDANLAGLCRAVLPQSCNRVPVSASRALQIELPLAVETVALNLRELCQIAHKCYLQQDDTATKKRLERLRKIFVSHYACLNKRKALCGVARKLSELPCIFVEGTQAFKLVKPNQLVKHIEPATALEPFRFQVSPYLLKYPHFLESLGIPERLSPIECAAILADINTEIHRCSGEISDDEPYLKVAMFVYNKLIRLLRERDHNYTLNPNLLFLPNEQNKLVKASTLIYNDVPWYAKRLQGKSTFELLKQPQPGPNGQRNPPASLGVRLMSTIVTEELGTEMDTPDVICHKELLYRERKGKERCSFVHKVQSTLRSPDLLEGLRRVYFHERREPPSEHFEVLIGHLCKLEVICIQTRIQTVLHIDHTVVPNTEDCSLFCFLSSNGDQLLLAPHCKEYSPDSLLKGLSSAVNKALISQVKNETWIAAMFQCEPANIRHELDSCRVTAYDPKTDSTMDKFHKPGDVVPLDKMTHQHLPIFVDYVKGEIAIYHSSDGLFRYAEVTEARPAQSISDCSVSIKTVGIQSSNMEDTLHVSPLLLYKVLTPSQRKTLTHNDKATSSFVTPVVLATPPCDSFTNLQGWIKNVYGMLQSQKCITGLVASMINVRLIGHLHYFLVVQKMGRGLFCPAVLEIQRLVLETDLPTCRVRDECEPDLHKALNDMCDSIKCMTLESDSGTDSDSDDAQSGHEMKSGSKVKTGTRNKRPVLGTREQSACKQQQKSSCAPRQPFSLPPKQYHYGYPAKGMKTPKSNHTSNMGMSSTHPIPPALPLQLPPPLYQPSHTRFPSHRGRRGQMPLSRHRLEQPQDLPKVRSPPVCLHSAKMWLEQAKADYRAALFLSKQFGADDSMEVDSEEFQGQANAYPALVCFLCHETLEKCLKGIVYAFCGLPSTLVNEGRLVSLLQPLKTSTHFPESLKQPLEVCVMHINQHEHMSRLPNYQNPPCAPAVMYSHCDAHEALSSVKRLLDCLVGDEKLKQLVGDIAQLPKPKFQSMLKSMGDSAQGKLVMHT